MSSTTNETTADMAGYTGTDMIPGNPATRSFSYPSSAHTMIFPVSSFDPFPHFPSSKIIIPTAKPFPGITPSEKPADGAVPTSKASSVSVSNGSTLPQDVSDPLRTDEITAIPYAFLSVTTVTLFNNFHRTGQSNSGSDPLRGNHSSLSLITITAQGSTVVIETRVPLNEPTVGPTQPVDPGSGTPVIPNDNGKGYVVRLLPPYMLIPSPQGFYTDLLLLQASLSQLYLL